MYIIKSGPKRVCRKGWAENITGPKKTGPKTKVGRKGTHPYLLRVFFDYALEYEFKFLFLKTK